MRKGRKYKKGTWMSRFFLSFVRRLFCHRNIIIISEHKTDHVPVSITLQLGVISAVLGFVVWASYSTGNYMAAQQALRDKERKIASASLENRRIESEFTLLKRDLIKMIEEDNTKQPSEYAKFVIEQYKNADKNGEEIEIDLSQLGAMQHGAVFERIQFLEKTVEGLKESHETMIESIRATAKGRLVELETIIKTTGLNPQTLEKKAEETAVDDEVSEADEARVASAEPQGGPYDPVSDEPLLAHHSELYNDLTRMNLLYEVIDTLPLSVPMNTDYKITSGFGMRIDPFRKRLARHTGIDFSGPTGAKVYSTSDGVVKEAGRRGAYGISIEIDHPLGLSTLYGHLSRVLVKEGQYVRKGDVIGIQGSTGRSTGAHLHYEVRYNGAKLNPAPFLKAGEKAGETQHVRKIKE